MHGTALGDLSNSNVSKFIIGGFQQHLGAPECSRGMDVELHRLMDEFRVYNIALTEMKLLFYIN
jgi:hypothetical protein